MEEKTIYQEVVENTANAVKNECEKIVVIQPKIIEYIDNSLREFSKSHTSRSLKFADYELSIINEMPKNAIFADKLMESLKQYYEKLGFTVELFNNEILAKITHITLKW